MNFNKLNEGYVFDSKSGAIGKAVGVDFIKNTITLDCGEEELVVANLADAVLLEKLGHIGSVEVHNHDLVVTADGKTYEIVGAGEGKVQLHLINKKLERVESGEVIASTDLHALEPYVTLIGNINEYEPEKEVEFNIVIVRDMTGGEFNGYYYACNNVEVKEVDLIKVIFIGSTLLKEESYERITVSHEEYLEMVESGDFKEVNPQELMNYVAGKQSFTTSSPSQFAGKADEDYEDEDEDICQECGRDFDDCLCEIEEEDEEEYEW